MNISVLIYVLKLFNLIIHKEKTIKAITPEKGNQTKEVLQNNYLRSYIKPARRFGLTPQTPQCVYVVKDTSSCYWNYMKALRCVLKSKRVEDPISQMTFYSIGGTVFRILALVSFPFVQKDEEMHKIFDDT